MKKSIVLIIAVLLAPIVALAQSQSAWYLIDIDSSGDIYFINDASKTNNGAWFFTWHDKITKDGERYYLHKQEYDCRTNVIGMRRFTSYTARGNPVFSHTFEGDFQRKEPIPETLGAAMLDAVCDRNNYKQNSQGEKIEPFNSIDEIAVILTDIDHPRASTKASAPKRKKK